MMANNGGGAQLQNMLEGMRPASANQPPNMRPGDWMCPACGNHNYADKLACNKCRVPKAGMAPQQPYGMPPGGMMQQGGWPRGAMPQGNMAYHQGMQHGNMMGMPPGMQHGMNPMMGGGGGSFPAPPNMRPGDWMCRACSNHNYADKVACNRCAAPKVHSFFSGAAYGNVAPGGGFPGTPNMRPGDWMCRACNNHNYADKIACNRCTMPKEVYIASTGMREGDWICSSCNNHNYADKTACNKCAVPKSALNITHVGTAGMGFKKRVRDGEWSCPACQNLNYASRVFCNKCSRNKPQ